MRLPDHIAERIRVWLERAPAEGADVDAEAARYGGVSMLGTGGGVWLLRPDGTLWEVDDDSGKELHPLRADLCIVALVAGAERHPWLTELLPRRPAGAGDCSVCAGRGSFEQGAYCFHCSALGWDLSSTVDAGICDAWARAGSDLAVDVQVRYVLALTHGQSVVVEAFLPHFGGTHGAALVSLADDVRCALVQGSDAFVSQISDSYRTYDARLFQDTLNEFGWFGPLERRPAWHTGQLDA